MNETSLDGQIASMALVDTSGDAFSSENLTGLPPEAGSGLFSMDNLLALAMNMSLAERCRLQQQAEEGLQDVACPSFFDKVSCWPRTPPNTTAVLPCFAELLGVPYDSSQNATRFCNVDGSWDNYTDYDRCEHVLATPMSSFEPSIELPSLIYYVGYSISLAALVVAVAVLVYFKDLRCLRNTIHVNLFLTYIMSSSLWILLLSLHENVKLEMIGCLSLMTLFHYFNTTNFFWMLVEGLYLYMLVVQTFSGDTLRFRKYAIIGWGGPLVFVIVWAIVKPFFPTSSSLEHSSLENQKKLEVECSWMRESHIDWIIQGPSFAVLVINLIFLLRIMWVLITKLRSANTVETRQYRKASKALLVLIPLLGITYLIVIYGPDEGVGSQIFAITRAILLSTQGFVVSLLYCFLNSEVRQTLRHHFYRWRDERNILSGKVNNHHRRPTFSKDNSPRSRTESTRLTTTTSAPLI
ncbi:diuretic hormone receptor-like [Anopheles ziemanni]|uniref:diuretic hormone receptor-like n=1 Tax=Anopheles coustani TaxID=139045 RepID=UPI0026599A57|nr:diuretic hormone receptor-like [Anopheles coustani]XP_058178036.1 diuretic hormone receptor-like [Anopheles ziemanni]